MNIATFEFQSIRSILRPYSVFVLVLSMLFALPGCSKTKKDNDVESAGLKKEPVSIQAKIEGASMAPTFKGEHFSTACPLCNAEFEYDSDSSRSLSKLCCPLCGERFANGANGQPNPAASVQLLKLEETHDLRKWDVAVKRWDVIAFTSHSGESNSIKRVIGLPLERIRFEHGDVLVKGSVVAKSPQVQLDTRILLFDSKYKVEGQLKFANQHKGVFPLQLDDVDLSFDYIQRANYDSPRNRQAEQVKDFYGYNQATTRSLNLCDDLCCELEFEDIDTESDPFQFVITIRTIRYGVLEFESVWTKETITRKVHQDGARIFGTISRRDKFDSTMKVYLGVIDGRVRFVHKPSFDNSSLLRQRNDSDWNGQEPQVSFGNKASNSAKLVRFKVFRDLYYFEKIPTEHKLGKDEYFVVGDNVPVSRDSRHGILPTESQIIGRVK